MADCSPRNRRARQHQQQQQQRESDDEQLHSEKSNKTNSNDNAVIKHQGDVVKDNESEERGNIMLNIAHRNITDYIDAPPPSISSSSNHRVQHDSPSKSNDE